MADAEKTHPEKTPHVFKPAFLYSLMALAVMLGLRDMLTAWRGVFDVSANFHARELSHSAFHALWFLSYVATGFCYLLFSIVAKDESSFLNRPRHPDPSKISLDDLFASH